MNNQRQDNYEINDDTKELVEKLYIYKNKMYNKEKETLQKCFLIIINNNLMMSIFKKDVPTKIHKAIGMNHAYDFYLLRLNKKNLSWKKFNAIF